MNFQRKVSFVQTEECPIYDEWDGTWKESDAQLRDRIKASIQPNRRNFPLDHLYRRKEDGRLYTVISKSHGAYQLRRICGPGIYSVDYADLDVEFTYYNP